MKRFYEFNDTKLKHKDVQDLWPPKKLYPTYTKRNKYFLYKYAPKTEEPPRLPDEKTIQKAKKELIRRAELGHTEGCQCQSRDKGGPCKELRKIVGFKVCEEIFEKSLS